VGPFGYSEGLDYRIFRIDGIVVVWGILFILPIRLSCPFLNLKYGWPASSVVNQNCNSIPSTPKSILAKTRRAAGKSNTRSSSICGST